MSEEATMGGQQPILQVTGRPAVEVLARLHALDGAVRVQTILRLALRDEAALQGVLRRMHSMGLELVEMHPVAEDVSPRVMEVVLQGAIGDVLLDSLSEHVEVRQTATRVTFADPDVLSKGIALVVAEGLAVEFASAVPSGAGSHHLHV